MSASTDMPDKEALNPVRVTTMGHRRGNGIRSGGTGRIIGSRRGRGRGLAAADSEATAIQHLTHQLPVNLGEIVFQGAMFQNCQGATPNGKAAAEPPCVACAWHDGVGKQDMVGTT